MRRKTLGVEACALRARRAAALLAKSSGDQRRRAIEGIVEGLISGKKKILEENHRDLESARKSGLPAPLIERLTLSSKRVAEMAKGVAEIAALPDPVGEIVKMWRRPNGMTVGRMRVPIGVIAVIYESRPNVTADVSALCLKSGNAALLRGGSEAIRSNGAIAKVIADACAAAGLPKDSVVFVETTGREAVLQILKLDHLVDLVIPRGGEGLIRTVVENSRIPVIRHDKGICHTFVDASADLGMAEEICFNAKVQRPATCNAMETMLVHRRIAQEFLPKTAARLVAAGVRLKGCSATRKILGAAGSPASAATEKDYRTEWLDLVLSIRVVDDLDQAMEHIARYGSQHSEAIVTRDHNNAMRFLREMDASAVFVNSSTRLNDGGQFGLGAEMGISTSRIHARGPMGVEELTCAKFIVLGDGQLRD